MKRTLIVLIIMLHSFVAGAQKSCLYGDAGLSLARFLPGASVTFNYNVFSHLGLGMGFQAYDFHATMSSFQYVPAVYGELRLNIAPQGRHPFFAFLDIGVDLYKHNNDVWERDNKYYKVRSDNGTYVGLGLAYSFRPTRRNWSPYVSLKLISNSYAADSYDPSTGKTGTAPWGDATLVTSFGFRF